MTKAMKVMKKSTIFFIMFALLLTVIPMTGIVEAADNPIVISNPMGTKSLPTPVTTSRVDLTGSFYGVTSLNYKVTQMRQIGNDLIPIQSREGVDAAYIVGSSFTFYGVELYQGINEIMVTGRDATGTSAPSERVYVEYSNLPIILTVNYNDQDLKINNIITDRLYRDELLIKGEVMNADTIVARINGDNTEYQGTVLSNGQYIIAKLPLQRGKNTLEIVARNNTKEYPVKVEFIYNDNFPYVGDAAIDVDGSGNFIELDKQMNFTDNKVEFTGVLNNFDLGDKVKFLFNSTNFTVTYDIFNSASPSDTVALVESAGYKLYKVSSNKFKLHYDSVNQNGTNILQYTFTRNLSDYTQSFYLEHFNNTMNYVTHTSGISSTTTSKKLTFYVFTKDTSNTNGVTIRHYNGATEIPITNRVSQALATEVRHTITVDLVPGNNTIIVRPNSGSDIGINEKKYSILYINSPDIKILNLVNGDRIGEGSIEQKIVGELVNVGLTNRKQTEVTIENRTGKSTYKLADADFESGTSYKFNFNLENKLQTGANDIVFKITDGVTTTTTRITVFYFSSDGPAASIEVNKEATKALNSEANFKETKLGAIETEARYIHINGSYSNAKDIIFYFNGVRVIQEKVLDSGAPTHHGGRNPVTNESFMITIDWNNKKFTTDYPIYLNEGSNVIEVEVISETGTSRSEKLQLNRVLPPVKLVSPNLERQNVVNSNFVEVIIEASGADSVKIGKEEAEYTKLSNDELRDLIGELNIKPNYDKNGDNILDDDELAAIDQGEIIGKRFVADVFLKPGKNTIKYEVVVNGNKKSYSFEIFYAASPDEGAKYKESFAKTKITVFDKELSLNFPKNTWLIEPDGTTPSMNKYVSDAFLEFGIVDKQTGKLNKIWDSTFDKYVFEDFIEPYKTLMPVKIIPPDRTGYASDIYWIEANGDILNVDAGLIPTNDGKITIKYDQSIVSDAQNQLSIYHFDRVKYEWVNLGGVTDIKGKTVTTTISEFGYYTVMAKRGTYTDIIKHSWAANYLHALYSKGIMMPESYNRFGSDLLTTRGEFATILIKALGVPLDAGPYINGNKLYPVNPSFVDVNPLLDPDSGFYTYDYIETAARAGIVRGMGQGEFNPDGLLTRQDAAAMIARAADYKIESNLDKSVAALQKMYADANKISNYSASYVIAVSKANIMSGSNVSGSTVFNPSSYLSRAEASAIAYRLMVQKKILPK